MYCNRLLPLTGASKPEKTELLTSWLCCRVNSCENHQWKKITSLIIRIKSCCRYIALIRKRFKWKLKRGEIWPPWASGLQQNGESKENLPPKMKRWPWGVTCRYMASSAWLRIMAEKSTFPFVSSSANTIKKKKKKKWLTWMTWLLSLKMLIDWKSYLTLACIWEYTASPAGFISPVCARSEHWFTKAKNKSKTLAGIYSFFLGLWNRQNSLTHP